MQVQQQQRLQCRNWVAAAVLGTQQQQQAAAACWAMEACLCSRLTSGQHSRRCAAVVAFMHRSGLLLSHDSSIARRDASCIEFGLLSWDFHSFCIYVIMQVWLPDMMPVDALLSTRHFTLAEVSTHVYAVCRPSPLLQSTLRRAAQLAQQQQPAAAAAAAGRTTS
jgi:hypothetical protein